jgi:hypothetical protein
MFVAPLEVFSLMNGSHSAELTIGLVPLSQVDAVRMVFVIVPLMIIVAVPIVVSPFARGGSHRNHQNAA